MGPGRAYRCGVGDAVGKGLTGSWKVWRGYLEGSGPYPISRFSTPHPIANFQGPYVKLRGASQFPRVPGRHARIMPHFGGLTGLGTSEFRGSLGLKSEWDRKPDFSVL